MVSASAVTVGHDRGQRGLGPFAALEEPLGEVGALAQLGDRDIDGPDASVEVAVTVAVALAGPGLGGPTVLGTDHGTRIS